MLRQFIVKKIISFTLLAFLLFCFIFPADAFAISFDILEIKTSLINTYKDYTAPSNTTKEIPVAKKAQTSPSNRPVFLKNTISFLTKTYNNYVLEPGATAIEKTNIIFEEKINKIPLLTANAIDTFSWASEYYDNYTSKLANILYGTEVLEKNIYTSKSIPESTPKISVTAQPLSPPPVSPLQKEQTSPIVKVTDSMTLTALRNLLSDPEIKKNFQGPAGPAGAQGPMGLVGPKGDPGTSVSYSPSQQPAFVGIIQPNPATNFSGATLFGATNLSSNHFSTNTANATTLTVTENSTLKTLEVTGNSTITGNLTVTGTVTGSGATTGTSLALSGALTALTFNGLTITTSTGTLTVANGKTLTISDSATLATNSITLAGGEVITFSASNALSLLTTGNTSVTLPTSGTLYGTVTDSITCLELLTSVSNETGTGALVFGTSPTFTTQITTPLVIGGTATTADLSLQTTSGVGASGADMHFLVGNNGATEAMTILNNGNIGIGTTAPASMFSVGASSQFQVDSSGNIVKLNNVTTSFPSSQGAANSFLRNDGVGTLTWAEPTSTGVAGFWQRNGTSLAPTTITDFVGIGTTAPTGKLHVVGQCVT